MAIQTQEQMKHSHLKNYTAVARATTSRVLGGGWPGWWLQRGARHELSSPPMHEMQSSTMSQLARVVELLLQLPQQSPARLRCHVLRSCRSVACADKAHTVKGDGVAEACAVRTHAACTSTLVALRPPLRVCEPFFKISFLALGSRSTSGSCRVQTTGRRDATVSSSITSRMAHRLGSLGYQPGPSKPDLGVRSAHQPPARACDFATSPFFRTQAETQFAV